FYGQATAHITDKLALTAGIRHTIDSTTADGGNRTILFFVPNTPTTLCTVSGSLNAANPDACLVRANSKSEKPTWVINLQYKPIDDIMVYGQYARGYRQGNVNVSNTTAFSWAPEKVDNYEIGAKTSFHGKVSGFFNIALFYNELSNQQLAANLIPDGSI